MSKENGGPAFPNTVLITNEDYASLRGMTLRDYFAAKAMQGLISRKECFNFDTFKDDPLRVARWAYDEADAMLKAKESTN